MRTRERQGEIDGNKGRRAAQHETADGGNNHKTVFGAREAGIRGSAPLSAAK